MADSASPNSAFTVRCRGVRGGGEDSGAGDAATGLGSGLTGAAPHADRETATVHIRERRRRVCRFHIGKSERLAKSGHAAQCKDLGRKIKELGSNSKFHLARCALQLIFGTCS